LLDLKGLAASRCSMRDPDAIGCAEALLTALMWMTPCE
jgi:hypothetical protein